MNILDVLTSKGLNMLVSDEREDALAKAWSDARASGYRCVYSRGTFLCTANSIDQCGPNLHAEEPKWDGTLRSIRSLIDDVERNYPECTVIYLAGGYDAADSPQAYFEFQDYLPWVGEWTMDVWKREG